MLRSKRTWPIHQISLQSSPLSFESFCPIKMRQLLQSGADTALPSINSLLNPALAFDTWYYTTMQPCIIEECYISSTQVLCFFKERNGIVGSEFRCHAWNALSKILYISRWLIFLHWYLYKRGRQCWTYMYILFILSMQ